MKNNRIGILLAVLLLFAMIGSGCSNGARSQTAPYVAVITKSTDSKFWKSVYGGANAAAMEYGVNLTLEGAENEEDYEAQNQLIYQAIENGAQAIVFSAIDANQSVEAIKAARDQGIYVVIIDSGINFDDIDVEITTNNYNAGVMAADAVLQNPARDLRIGIVNFDVNSANGAEREAGFKDKIKGNGRATIVDVINVESNISASDKGAKKMLSEHPDINVIATFNEWTTLGVGFAMQELGCSDQVQVIGFDSNVILADMLEKGDMDGLIIQNPFAIGYLGIEKAYDLIRRKSRPEEVIYTDTTLITRDTMFDEASQRILFPIEDKE